MPACSPCLQRIPPTDFEALMEFKKEIKQAFKPVMNLQELIEEPELYEGLRDPQVRCTLPSHVSH